MRYSPTLGSSTSSLCQVLALCSFHITLVAVEPVISGTDFAYQVSSASSALRYWTACALNREGPLIGLARVTIGAVCVKVTLPVTSYRTLATSPVVPLTGET